MNGFALKKDDTFVPESIVVPPASSVQSLFHSVSASVARSPLAHRALSAFLLVGLPGVGAYAHLVEPTWLRLKRLTVPIPNLPIEFDGFRIVHLSDLHVGSALPQWFLRHVVKTVQNLSPDLIVLTGDFVHTRPEEGDRLTHLLQDCRAAHGVFAVLGNHDYGVNYPGHDGFQGAEAIVITALERAGIEVLRNELIYLKSGRKQLVLYGVDELWSGQAQISPLLRVSPSLTGIVLCHNPDILQFLPQQRSDLVLCGHTHGGQIRIPPFPPPLTMTKDRRHWGGLIPHGQGWVYVSRGIGYTWRVRFASRPECVEVTLRRGDK
ncbi:MAG: metallophosphoesterase [Candidatus Binatia bacterium]